jgi:hypothetical protein
LIVSASVVQAIAELIRKYGLPRTRRGPPARGLLEADPAVADLGLTLDRRQCHGSDADLSRAELDPRDSDVPAPEMAVVDDLAVVPDLEERSQLVRLPEGVRVPQRVEVLDHVRRRIVVVDDAHRERELRQPLDGLGRDPRDCGDGRFDAHGESFRWDLGN